MAQSLQDSGVELVIMETNANVKKVAREMNTCEVPIHGIIANFKVKESVTATFCEAMEIPEDLDILVNNTRMQTRHFCLGFPLDGWETVHKVNLTSVFILSKLAGEVMLAKGYGKIINIASLRLEYILSVYA